jgi:hypothetical protein
MTTTTTLDTATSQGSTDWDKVVVIPQGGSPLTLSVRKTPFVDEADRLNYLQEMHAQVKAVLDALRIPGVEVECYCGEVRSKGNASELSLAMLSLLLHLTNDIRQHPLFKPAGK